VASLILSGYSIFSQHQNNIHCLVCWFAIITNNYRARLSEISWFVSYQQINYLPKLKAEAYNNYLPVQGTDKSWYFAIPEFNNNYCFIIWSPFFWSTKYVKPLTACSGIDPPFSHKSVVSILQMSRILFAAKHLFVGSYLQVTWWALSQWKGRKNTSSYNNFYYDQMKLL